MKTVNLAFVTSMAFSGGMMLSCSSSPTKTSTPAESQATFEPATFPKSATLSRTLNERNVSGRNLADRNRKPAQEADQPDEMPPVVKSRAGWMFSWSHHPLAQSDAKAYIQGQFAHAQDCLAKFKQSSEPLPHCEGDQMAAGPGLYVVDNPFTSHGYGTTVVMLRTLDQTGSAYLVTGKFAPGQASGGVDRSIFSNPDIDAIVYDFRATPFDTRAIAMRSDRIVDSSQTSSFTLSQNRQRFAQHEDHDCAQDHSIQEVFAHWGDEIEFMSLAYFPEIYPEETFAKAGRLQAMGFVAALAADVGQVPDAQVASTIANLKKISPAIKDSLGDSACTETYDLTPRACLVSRVFASLVERQDHGNTTYYAWNKSDLIKAAAVLGLTNSKMGPISTISALRAKLVQNFQSDKTRVAHANQAYQCMVHVSDALKSESLKTWGDDPY